MGFWWSAYKVKLLEMCGVFFTLEKKLTALKSMYGSNSRKFLAGSPVIVNNGRIWGDFPANSDEESNLKAETHPCQDLPLTTCACFPTYNIRKIRQNIFEVLCFYALRIICYNIN